MAPPPSFGRRVILGGALAVGLLGLGVGRVSHAGLFGSSAPGRIPIPARVFAVTIEDVGGTQLRVDRVTFDGEVYLFGTVGKAQVTVPFETIASVTVGLGPDDDHRTASVVTADGATVDVVVEADRPFYGRTAFGNYKIEASDVRRIGDVAGP